jgi:SAM-dependent methyltransferase
MSELLSLQSAANPAVKDRLKINLGRALSVVFPNRAIQLKNRPTNYAVRRSDRLIMAFLRDQARRCNDTRFFENFHREFWAGDGGTVFSSNCDHRFEDIFLSQQKDDFTQLQEVWAKGRFENIVEIGCCSGLLTEYLTTSLPGVASAVGIDLNEAQISANRCNADYDSKINFLCTDGFEYVCSKAQPNTLFVTNGGVLEYFSRSQLDQMLSHVSGNVGECLFFAVEPVAPDHDWSVSRESIPFGEELSFSHNYKDVFETNGFEILHQRHVDFESWRLMATLAWCE